MDVLTSTKKITLDDYPGFFYHKVTNSETMNQIETIRRYVHMLANEILDLCPSNRERSVALTELQKVSMFAIASLAITGEKQVPIGSNSEI